MQSHDDISLAMATIQRHDTLAYNENTSTGSLAQGRQAELQYFGTKAAKQAPVFDTKRQTKNQYLAQFAFIQILLPVVH